MQENNSTHLFDIKPIISDVEKVIQQGLNKFLVKYIERYELLEKTHKKLMKLPSIANEFKLKQTNLVDNFDSELDTDSETVCTDKQYNISNFINIEDISSNIVEEQISSFDKRLEKMEKRFDSIIF